MTAAPSISISGAPSSSASAATPAPCKASAMTMCLRDAQLEDAVLLLSTVLERPAVVLGNHSLRLSGAIEGKAPFVKLASAAYKKHVYIDAFEVDGAVWMADWFISREKPTPKRKAPPGCNKKVDVSLVQTGVVRDLVRLTADVHKLTTDDPSTVVEIGHITVFGKDVDVCLLLTHAVELAGGTLLLKGNKLTTDGAGHISGETGVGASAPICAPLGETDMSCFPKADLEVIGIAGEADKRRALVRSHYGRNAYERSMVVWVGKHVGREQVQIQSIGDDGLHDDKGGLIPLAPP